jgi:hypothetical protein
MNRGVFGDRGESLSGRAWGARIGEQEVGINPVRVLLMSTFVS